MADHRDERTLDWRTASPRWLLLAIIFVAVGWGAFASSFAWSLYQAREADRDQKYSDWKGGAIAEHEQRITVLERETQTLKETQVRIDADSKFARLTAQMENANSKLDYLTSKLERALKEN